MVELGPLVRLERVLDGQLVEAQLVGQLVELRPRSGSHRSIQTIVVGVGERTPTRSASGEVLGRQLAVDVHARVRVSQGWRSPGRDRSWR